MCEYQKPQKTASAGWKIFFGIILGFSILINVAMLFAIIGSLSLISVQTGRYITEETIEGAGADKIAVISIEGIINSELCEKVCKQIKKAQNDPAVKAVIFKTVSPGGGIAASDRIYDRIMRFKKQTSKPTVAFMQTVAASGGLYTSCGCDKIIAEPTTITGSIGVIMGHFVVKQLLEEKLGITPFVAKSGEKKNWPTSFEPVSEAQQQYLNDKLITPAYERFVDIVANARQEFLTYDQVKALADGSIYNAPEALENKLIDEIGYFDEAVEMAKSMAGLTDAKIIKYKEPFSFEDFLSAKTGINLRLNADTLYNLLSPQMMYIWLPAAGK